MTKNESNEALQSLLATRPPSHSKLVHPLEIFVLSGFEPPGDICALMAETFVLPVESLWRSRCFLGVWTPWRYLCSDGGDFRAPRGESLPVESLWHSRCGASLQFRDVLGTRPFWFFNYVTLSETEPLWHFRRLSPSDSLVLWHFCFYDAFGDFLFW